MVELAATQVLSISLPQDFPNKNVSLSPKSRPALINFPVTTTVLVVRPRTKAPNMQKSTLNCLRKHAAMMRMTWPGRRAQLKKSPAALNNQLMLRRQYPMSNHKNQNLKRYSQTLTKLHLYRRQPKSVNWRVTINNKLWAHLALIYRWLASQWCRCLISRGSRPNSLWPKKSKCKSPNESKRNLCMMRAFLR